MMSELTIFIIAFVAGAFFGVMIAALCAAQRDDRRELSDTAPERDRSCSEILDEMKADDYYLYCRKGISKFSENDWDWLIDNVKEREKDGRSD